MRDDGSCTWEYSHVGVKHDLIHYAVETTLGYRDAFFGLVAQGRDIDSFGTKDGKKDGYTKERGCRFLALPLATRRQRHHVHR